MNNQKALSIKETQPMYTPEIHTSINLMTTGTSSDTVRYNTRRVPSCEINYREDNLHRSTTHAQISLCIE
jgi:hypothetical protein